MLPKELLSEVGRLFRTIFPSILQSEFGRCFSGQYSIDLDSLGRRFHWEFASSALSLFTFLKSLFPLRTFLGLTIFSFFERPTRYCFFLLAHRREIILEI